MEYRIVQDVDPGHRFADRRKDSLFDLFMFIELHAVGGNLS